MIPLAGICSLLLWCSPAHSQTLGRISGIVTDTSGGAIAGATVAVTDVPRSVTRTVTTDATGTYSAANLLPSTYSVHTAYMGFKGFDRQDIVLGVGGDVHVDVTLQPGEQTQTVTVTGEVPTITTTNAQLATTITGQTLADLPVAGHNWVQMLALLPTYQLRQGSATGPNQYSNGVRAEYNIYVLDGVTDFMTYYTTGPVNVGYTAGGPEQATMLPTDSIQEFNVVQNSKAEYGWRPGAQINVGIKSGTNAIHGAAFASGRSTGLTNRNAFGTFIPPVSFEDFDATIGGPIKKDKLFYLLGYEGQLGNVGNPKVLTQPTLQSTGSTTNSVPDAINSLISHGVTPNPVTMALAGCTIGPPVTCTPGAGVFANNTPSTTFPVDFTATTKTNNGIGRLDYHLNDHHNLSAELFDGDGFGLIPLNATQGYWSVPLEAHVLLARAMWTWVPNSNWVQDLRFGWDSMIAFSNTGSYDCPSQPSPFGGFTDNQWVPGAGAPNYATAFGFVSGGQPACGSGNNSAFPTITINGFTTTAQAATFGGAGGSFTTSGIERWVDSVSWTHGNHITKFGGDFMLAHGTPVLNVQNYKGTLNFNNNNLTLCAFPNAANTACGATPLQNFMAGIVTTASIQVGAVSRQFSYHGIAGFIQDDWRIFPRLTVNLGLRYENTSTIHEVNGLIGNVAFGTPTGVTQQGQGGPLYKLDPWGFAPRFGLAWDISGKGTTVLRTGFNIAYQNPTIQAFITPGMTLIPTGIKLSNGTTSITEGGTINTQNLSAFAPSSKTAATIVAGQQFFGGNVTNLVGTCSPTVPCAIGGAASHLDMPMIMNWSFGVQHAITNNLTVDVNYVGTHGQHLFDFSDINQPAPGANTNPTVENGRRPLTQYPWLSQIKVLGAITNVSNYNGLQIIATQRFHRGLSFIATYAYAHALDSGSSDLTPLVPENSLAPQNEYGNSTYDLRHRFTFGPSYEIPGKKGFAQMLQGWQVASTVKLFSGFPINAIDPTTPLGGDDISGTGEGQDRWDLVGNPHDFNGFGNAAPIPCFYNPAGNPGAPNTSAFSKSGCTAGLPAACSNGAASEPNSPVGTGITAPGNTAIFELNKLGCYMKGDSVIIPPAPGTFGTMSRDEIYSIGTWEWDGSIVKAFKFGERITAQFRADLYNVTNTTFFAAASATLSSPSTFGASGSTPDVNSPFVGTGGPRKIQLGLKLLF